MFQSHSEQEKQKNQGKVVQATPDGMVGNGQNYANDFKVAVLIDGTAGSFLWGYTIPVEMSPIHEEQAAVSEWSFEATCP